MVEKQFVKIRDDSQEVSIFDRKKQITVGGIFRINKGPMKGKYMPYVFYRGKAKILLIDGVSKTDALKKVKTALKIKNLYSR